MNPPADALPLPRRVGPVPRVTGFAPQVQLDQLTPSLRAELVERMRELPGVHLAPSRRAPKGSVGAHLDTAACCGDAQAFLIDCEFAHVHAGEDGSMHLVLPEPMRTQAIEAGWATPHPLAGQPTVSPGTLMVYAPRDPAELDVVSALVRAAWRNATQT